MLASSSPLMNFRCSEVAVRLINCSFDLSYGVMVDDLRSRSQTSVANSAGQNGGSFGKDV